MDDTSKLNQPRKRDMAYYRQRQKNRVFVELVHFFAEEAERRGVTKKDLALSLKKNPSQITRWLSAPSNFELDTLSDILLALGAEMDHRIVRFEDRPQQNFAHPLVVTAYPVKGPQRNLPPHTSSGAEKGGKVRVEGAPRGIKVEADALVDQ